MEAGMRSLPRIDCWLLSVTLNQGEIRDQSISSESATESDAADRISRVGRLDTRQRSGASHRPGHTSLACKASSSFIGSCPKSSVLTPILHSMTHSKEHPSLLKMVQSSQRLALEHLQSFIYYAYTFYTGMLEDLSFHQKVIVLTLLASPLQRPDHQFPQRFSRPPHLPLQSYLRLQAQQRGLHDLTAWRPSDGPRHDALAEGCRGSHRAHAR